MNRLAAARGTLREIEKLQAVVHPRLRLVGPTARWWLCAPDDDYAANWPPSSRDSRWSSGKAPSRKSGSDLRGSPCTGSGWNRRWRITDINTAAKDSGAVRELQPHSLHTGWWPWEVFAASLHELTGEYAAGLSR